MLPKKPTIGERLIKARGSRRREEVAAACAVSAAAIGMYETDKRVPRDEIKVRLAHYYRTTVQALFF